MKVETVLLFANYTTEEWKSIDVVIPKGCPCVEFDGTSVFLKIGDGEKTYQELPYVSDPLTRDIIIKALGFTPMDDKMIDAPLGLPKLTEAKTLPMEYMPDEVRNVRGYKSTEDFPEVGVKDVLYVDTTTSIGYMWNGKDYIRYNLGDSVAASKKNGYLNVNGKDTKVYEPDTIDEEVDANSDNAVSGKAVAEYTKSLLTTVATTKKAGVIKCGNAVETAEDGMIRCKSFTRSEYQKKSDDIFVSKGTLDILLDRLQKQIDAIK
mgnify:FL=1